MKNLKLTFSLAFILFAMQSQAQETLREKYDAMLEKTETYEQYKVIPRTTLNSFWSEALDSLKQQARTIRDLRSQVTGQQGEINSLRAEIAEVQSKLDESLELNDTIYFLGMPFSKVGYHIMVWLIIAALAVLGVMSYLMFIRSNSVTSKTRREYETLNAEYEEHKTHARETQVKLKRELQTAINQLNERR
ncbi:MAG: hypothetical protein RLN88_08930 [Ekhidna sp.]|uniref:hypothetical protein n=1 Tax=Ekhidna sp. TaxID=2608089 RepID=UPI0032ECDA25